MGATATVVFSSNSISHLSSFSVLCKPKLGIQIPKACSIWQRLHMGFLKRSFLFSREYNLQGDSTSSKKRSTKSSEEKPAVDSVLEILRHSKTQPKGKTSNTKDDKGPTHERGQKEQETDYSPSSDPRSRRPRSSFVKKSPTKSPFNSKGNVELKIETSVDNHVEREAVKIGEMKLPQLKELAKSRGLEDYS
ncbi:unnamed protein product [Withania somnifera]